MGSTSTRYLDREFLDTEKWDRVVSRSPGETLYPYSWYLDASAENWSALIQGDYRFIMPLVWKKKYGIRYLYQPFFCQQLGVFSEEFVDPFLIQQFNAEALNRFRFGVLSFNVKNMVGDGHALDVYDRTNYVLALDRSYEALHNSYSTNAKRNLKTAMEQIKSVDKEVSLDELIELKRANDDAGRSESHFRRMRAQFESVLDNSKGMVYGVRTERGLVAASFLAFSKSRVIYLLSVSNPEGKEKRAMFRIVDQVIRDYSNSYLSLDFEGSTIPSIARFFSGFGAKPEIYQSMAFNRLPFSFILRKGYGRS
jgi:hypothetical protein